jgi:hypothetical protein
MKEIYNIYDYYLLKPLQSIDQKNNNIKIFNLKNIFFISRYFSIFYSNTSLLTGLN